MTAQKLIFDAMQYRRQGKALYSRVNDTLIRSSSSLLDPM
jgi:hypothetical protein